MKEYDCLEVGARCEDCPYSKEYKNKRGEISITCDPKKLKLHNILKVGMGISVTKEEWNATFFPTSKPDMKNRTFPKSPILGSPYDD